MRRGRASGCVIRGSALSVDQTRGTRDGERDAGRERELQARNGSTRAVSLQSTPSRRAEHHVQALRRKTVSSEELDRLIATVEADEEEGVVTDEIERYNDDQEIDELLMNHLETVCYQEERNIPNPSGPDIIDAVDALGLKLATIYRAEGREDMVVVIDGQAETDALVWAMVSYLPDWITSRYGNLMAAHPDARLLPIPG